MFWEGLITARDLGRLHDIASVLIRYGFSDFVQRMGVGTLLEKAGKILRLKEPTELTKMDTPKRVCSAMQELGPTFIKLGQILATRVDLFPPEWIAEFETLQDRIPPMPFDEISEQLQEDLGAPAQEIFPHLETEALAAASIAQVHKARLEDGSEVVLKIRRPGIRAKIEADLRLLGRVADIAEREIEELRRFHPKEIVREFTHSLRRELDLASEGRYMERAAAHFKDDPNIVIAKVYWQWTCERLNVQSYLHGIQGRDLKTVEEQGLDRKLLAQRGANAVLKMVLEDGFYHADPHAGNVLYLPDNRIAFLDFGMMGRLSDTRREQIVNLLSAMVNKDVTGVTDILLDWAGDTHADIDNLAIEVDAFLDSYHGVPLKQLKLSSMLSDVTVIMRNHQLTLPPDLTLLFKVFITLEGLGRQLDPEFDMVAQATPFLQRAMLLRYTPESLAKRGLRNLSNVVDIIASMPQDIRRLLRTTRRGGLQVHVDITKLDKFGKQIDRAASRITVGLVTAALIVGSSIVMTVSGGPTFLGLPIFGFLGFLAAGISGIWVLISIYRGGKGT
ncbi:MAG: ubiquinone biosynthesis protein UbiB [Gammaproteobacteria bacterium SG8_11]|nr:MAG: ubiquinone biosynthesis protein UbiB [Gammaproteobacteria bacterium SG8_11]